MSKTVGEAIQGGKSKWAVALQCLIRLGYLEQRLTVYTVTTVNTICLLQLTTNMQTYVSPISIQHGSLAVSVRAHLHTSGVRYQQAVGRAYATVVFNGCLTS